MLKLTKDAVIAEMNALMQQRDPRARFDPNAPFIGALVEVFCEKINALIEQRSVAAPTLPEEQPT